MGNNSTASQPTAQLEQLPLKIAKLDNGLTVMLQEQHASAVVAVQIWVGVGSADELPGERGMAHFCEHMLFKGTPRRGVGQVALEIEGAGGNVNASTSHDVTVYYATLPSSELATGIDVLCDMVRHPSFPMLEIAREIEVVSEEIREDQDSPTATVADALFGAAYTTHGYRSPILGTHESVTAFTREDLVDFFRRWYGPDNLTVVLVGDFSEGHALGLVHDAFAGAEPRGARPARTPEPPRVGLRHTTLRRPFERASVQLAWPVPALSHPDVPLLDLLARLLGGCDTSRLVQSVKEPAGFIDYVGASAHTPLDAGLFRVSFGIDAGHTEADRQAAQRGAGRAPHASPPGAQPLSARLR